MHRFSNTLAAFPTCATAQGMLRTGSASPRRAAGELDEHTCVHMEAGLAQHSTSRGSQGTQASGDCRNDVPKRSPDGAQRQTLANIQRTRQWFAQNAMNCIAEAESGKVFVNDLANYRAWREKEADDSLKGEYDHTLTFRQQAHYMQTGECIPLFSPVGATREM